MKRFIQAIALMVCSMILGQTVVNADSLNPWKFKYINNFEGGFIVGHYSKHGVAQPLYFAETKNVGLTNTYFKLLRSSGKGHWIAAALNQDGYYIPNRDMSSTRVGSDLYEFVVLNPRASSKLHAVPVIYVSKNASALSPIKLPNINLAVSSEPMAIKSVLAKPDADGKNVDLYVSLSVYGNNNLPTQSFVLEKKGLSSLHWNTIASISNKPDSSYIFYAAMTATKKYLYVARNIGLGKGYQTIVKFHRGASKPSDGQLVVSLPGTLPIIELKTTNNKELYIATNRKIYGYRYSKDLIDPHLMTIKIPKVFNIVGIAVDGKNRLYMLTPSAVYELNGTARPRDLLSAGNSQDSFSEIYYIDKTLYVGETEYFDSSGRQAGYIDSMKVE